MAWIKNALVDVAVTALVVFASIQHVAWARWLVLGYTGLMLVLKLAALLLAGTMPKLRQDASSPAWFLHSLYAVNVAAPLLTQWWLVGAGWALIWALSVAAEARTRPRLGTSGT